MKIAPPEHILDIIRTLQAAGHQAVLVGGCVRDALLGNAPHDWDVASSATPEQVEALFPETYAVGRQFGIIVVHTKGEDVEVAMFRTDGDYRDGRHPGNVEPCDMAGDALRRDFTINALMVDPLSGKLYDFTGGQEDLKRGMIRAVGDPTRRFTEDKLRMLRAIRFAARLSFEIEAGTLTAIAPLASDIRQVSSERIANELSRMLTEGNAQTAFGRLRETGLLEQILPEVAAMIGVEQPPQFHPEGDVWTHTLLLLAECDKTCRRCKAFGEEPGVEERFDGDGRLCRADSGELLCLAWAALLHDVGKPPTKTVSDRIRFNGHDIVGSRMAADILRRLKFSSDMTDSVERLVHSHMMLTSFGKMREARKRRFLRDERTPLLLELCRFDVLASFGGVELHDAVVRAWQEEHRRPAPMKNPVRGHDLIALGMTPGPVFKELLEELANGFLEGRFRDKAEALEWVKTQVIKDLNP